MTAPQAYRRQLLPLVGLLMALGLACDADAPLDEYWVTTFPSSPGDAIEAEVDEPDFAPQRDLDDPSSSACGCASTECFEAWIEEHLGCGLCVVFFCDGEHTHACVPCDVGSDP